MKLTLFALILTLAACGLISDEPCPSCKEMRSHLTNCKINLAVCEASHEPLSLKVSSGR